MSYIRCLSETGHYALPGGGGEVVTASILKKERVSHTPANPGIPAGFRRGGRAVDERNLGGMMCAWLAVANRFEMPLLRRLIGF